LDSVQCLQVRPGSVAPVRPLGVALWQVVSRFTHNVLFTIHSWFNACRHTSNKQMKARHDMYDMLSCAK